MICSKFITFAVTKTTLIWYLAENQRSVECVRNKKDVVKKEELTVNVEFFFFVGVLTSLEMSDEPYLILQKHCDLSRLLE